MLEIKLSIGCSVAWGCCCFRFIFIFSRVLRVSGDFMAFFFEGGGGGVGFSCRDDPTVPKQP